jgi:hypothetical protein
MVDGETAEQRLWTPIKRCGSTLWFIFEIWETGFIIRVLHCTEILILVLRSLWMLCFVVSQKCTDVSEVLTTSTIALITQAISTSEMLVSLYKTTRGNNPQYIISILLAVITWNLSPHISKSITTKPLFGRSEVVRFKCARLLQSGPDRDRWAPRAR